MTRRVVRVANVVNRRPDLAITIKPDSKWPGQLFVQAPPVSSLTDALEEMQQ